LKTSLSYKINHSPQTTVLPDHSPLSLHTRTVEVALGWNTHMGGHRHKLPPTVAGHIDYTIGYSNGGHSILVWLTLGVVVIWKGACCL